MWPKFCPMQTKVDADALRTREVPGKGSRQQLEYGEQGRNFTTTAGAIALELHLENTDSNCNPADWWPNSAPLLPVY